MKKRQKRPPYYPTIIPTDTYKRPNATPAQQPLSRRISKVAAIISIFDTVQNVPRYSQISKTPFPICLCSHLFLSLTRPKDYGMDWQEITVAVIGVVVAGIVLRAIVRRITGRNVSSCASCSDTGCPLREIRQTTPPKKAKTIKERRSCCNRRPNR